MRHQVQAADNHKTFAVQTGDFLEVQLEEAPTTGYAWDVDSVGNICELESSDYSLNREAGIGGGGTRTIVFLVRGKGREKISLKNWQRWSGDIYKRFEIEVSSS